MSRKTINRRDAKEVQRDFRPARFPESSGHGSWVRRCLSARHRGRVRRGSINAKHQGRGIHNDNQKVGSLEVSEIGFGNMTSAAATTGRVDRAQGIRADSRCHERGVTFFDTAEVYGPYVNEELVGEALAPVRDKALIATKFGFKIDGTNGLDSRPERIRRVVEESLKRLGTDRIDLAINTASISQCPSKTWPARS